MFPPHLFVGWGNFKLFSNYINIGMLCIRVMDILYAVSGILACESPEYSVDGYSDVRGRKISHVFNSIFLLTSLH